MANIPLDVVLILTCATCGYVTVLKCDTDVCCVAPRTVRIKSRGAAVVGGLRERLIGQHVRGDIVAVGELCVPSLTYKPCGCSAGTAIVAPAINVGKTFQAEC